MVGSVPVHDLPLGDNLLLDDLLLGDKKACAFSRAQEELQDTFHKPAALPCPEHYSGAMASGDNLLPLPLEAIHSESE